MLWEGSSFGLSVYFKYFLLQSWRWNVSHSAYSQQTNVYITTVMRILGDLSSRPSNLADVSRSTRKAYLFIYLFYTNAFSTVETQFTYNPMSEILTFQFVRMIYVNRRTNICLDRDASFRSEPHNAEVPRI